MSWPTVTALLRPFRASSTSCRDFVVDVAISACCMSGVPLPTPCKSFSVSTALHMGEENPFRKECGLRYSLLFGPLWDCLHAMGSGDYDELMCVTTRMYPSLVMWCKPESTLNAWFVWPCWFYIKCQAKLLHFAKGLGHGIQCGLLLFDFSVSFLLLCILLES